MHLLAYAFHMYLRQCEMLPLALASKLGLHPLTKAVLVARCTSPPKQPPAGPWQLKIVKICNALVGLCFFMWIGNNLKFFCWVFLLLGLALKLGLHPVARL
jgi:hypothetical protein